MTRTRHGIVPVTATLTPWNDVTVAKSSLGQTGCGRDALHRGPTML